MREPKHPQLMDPADDPEALIASSIYWHPLSSPDRTAVLDHLMLTNGNGYEWGEDGNIRSVFARIEPERDRLDSYEAEARKWEERARSYLHASEQAFARDMAAHERAEHARLLSIQADCQRLARTCGPVRTFIDYGRADGKVARTISSRELAWTLLGEVPKNVTPAWQSIVSETRALFAPILTEQGTLW